MAHPAPKITPDNTLAKRLAQIPAQAPSRTLKAESTARKPAKPIANWDVPPHWLRRD